VQEVALVLLRIGAAQQLEHLALRSQARVVPGGDARRAQVHGVIEERLELDLGIAQHVRIGRAAGLVFAQEFGEHAVLVLGREVDRLERDVEHVRSARGVEKILAGGAVLLGVVVLPVLHEEPDDVVALALQQQRCDRRIDAPGHSYDDPLSH
jgi:hypothetical protein